jgi:hypothetical protein
VYVFIGGGGSAARVEAVTRRAVAMAGKKTEKERAASIGELRGGRVILIAE